MKLKVAPAVSAGHWLKLVTLAVMGLAQALKSTNSMAVTQAKANRVSAGNLRVGEFMRA
jgi:hypothetical protein